MFKRLRELFNSVTELHRAALEAGTHHLGWEMLKRDLPAGDGHPVLILPGFMTNDTFTAPLRQRVEEKGYKAHTWDNGMNLGFDEATAQHLKKRLKEVYEASGKKKVSLVGHSLGGIYARELAREFPHMVRDVITLGTPFGGMDDPASGTSAALSKFYDAMNPNSVHKGHDDIGARCLTPPPVPTTSLYSQTDGIINWKAALNPKRDESENVEVYGSHLGMTANPITIAVVLDRLAQKEGEWKPFDKAKYPALFMPANDAPATPDNPKWTDGGDKKKQFFKKKPKP
jgi:pimeloyl-ACP methyl ester carboxylesterase